MTARSALVVLSVVLAVPARGEEVIGVVAVADPPGPDAALVELTGKLRAALAARAPGVLAGAALRARMEGRAAPAALAELDRAYAGALAAHAGGEYEASNRTLRGVIEALEALPEAPEVFTAWTRAMLRLARSEQELGRGVEAQAVLERLLRAAPDQKADPRQFPPSFQGLVEEARARLRALGTRRLTVEAGGPARIFVEGREVGRAPVSLDLAPGRYRVVGIRAGIASPAAVVELAEDRTIALDLSLADALRPEAGPGLALAATERPVRLAAAISRLALDRAVVTSLHADGEAVRLAAALRDVRRGGPGREGWIALPGGAPRAGAVEALAAWLLDGRASALVETPLGPSVSLEVAPPEALAGPPLQAAVRPRRGSALGWTAVGVGVATVVAGSVAIVYGREAQARYDEARGMLDGAGRLAPPYTVAGYNAAIAAGDDRRASAVALGVGAGLGAATTAVLSWLSYRQSGEIGPFRF